MTRTVEAAAEALARGTHSRRSFLGRFGKATFIALAGLAAGIPSSMIAEASDCNFGAHGSCSGCPMEGCPANCTPDYSSHDRQHQVTYCWSVTNPYALCCDCWCSGSQCGCRSYGVAPAA